MIPMLLLSIAIPVTALAGPIGPLDFAPGSTVLGFDEFAHETFLSTEFAALGVIFGSESHDGLSPPLVGAPFVRVSVAVPTTSTSSLPNKIVGTVVDPNGNLFWCDPCSIVVSFLDPLPTQVGFFVTDPDVGQSARFFGASGLVGTLSVTGGSNSNYPFFFGLEDSGGISRVVLKTVPCCGVGMDDLRFGAPVPEPGTGSLILGGLAILVLRRRWAASAVPR